MGSLQIVPKKPVHKLLVEGRDVVPEERPASFYEVLRDGAVEAFDARVHLGRAWIGVEVRDGELHTRIFKVFGELAPVVSLQLVDRERNDQYEFFEEICGRCRGVACVCPRKGELLFNVDRSDDVPLHSVNEADDGVELHATLHHTTELLSLERVPFMVFPAPCIERELLSRGKEVFLFEVTNDPANVRLGDGMPFFAKENRELLLAKTGMHRAFCDNERLDRGRDHSHSPSLRSRALGIEGVDLSRGSFKHSPPTEESATRDVEGISGRFLSMCSPEVQYLRSAVYFVLIAHMPEAYDAFVHGQPALRALENVELLHCSSVMRSAKCF